MGIGPGHPLDRTLRAEAAITESDVVVGYSSYLERVEDLTRDKETVSSGMRHELDRCRAALERARDGARVALISSGDAGVYGMAGLAIELAAAEGFDVPIEIIPGVTAASSAAALLGAPLMLDFAAISLSDLLVPWPAIKKRLAAALDADFVIVLYNPSSKKRRGLFEEAVELALAHRSPATHTGVVTAIGLPDETVVLTRLGDLLEEEVTMMSTVIIANSSAKVIGPWLVTPRGYEL